MRVRALVLLISILSFASTAAADKPSARETLAARRAKTIERLHAYRVAEVFPTDAAGLPLGVFRDDKGVRCPMSELMFLSGRSDLVDAVVKLDNKIRLADVKGGPIYDWLLQSGLTQEEAIQIQGAMEYGGNRFGEPIRGTQLVYINQVPTEVTVGASQSDLDAAHAAVIAKLEAAEEMLKTNTATALTSAVDRLADRRKAIAAATGKTPAEPVTAARARLAAK